MNHCQYLRLLAPFGSLLFARARTRTPALDNPLKRRLLQDLFFLEERLGRVQGVIIGIKKDSLVEACKKHSFCLSRIAPHSSFPRLGSKWGK